MFDWLEILIHMNSFSQTFEPQSLSNALRSCNQAFPKSQWSNSINERQCLELNRIRCPLYSIVFGYLILKCNLVKYEELVK